jgi:DNA-binding NtrC family response regulator
MTKRPHILVVDDEPAIRLTLETGLSLKGFTTSHADGGLSAIQKIQTETVDAVICDLVMPECDGLSVVRAVREFDRDLPIILMTAQGSLEAAVTAVQDGASDIIAKPFEIATVAAMLRRFLAARNEVRINDPSDDPFLSERFSQSGLIGRSPGMVAVYKLIAFAARTNATLLITGESGTGKELVARSVHNFSERYKQRFVSVNCSGLTDTLLEAELFGYEKGAFTGANSTREGLFEAANGGTIFLDELASTSPSFQASLLRVLQSGEIRRVGSTETRKVDVRIIGASNQNLQQLSESGRFRTDLYYRLSVLTIELPPLRERPGDVPILTRHFLGQMVNVGESAPYMTQEVWDSLSSYDFPGNVRELENALVRALALSTGKVITLECLPAGICEAAEVNRDLLSESGILREILGDRPTLEELQRRYLCLILTEVGGNRRRAAEKLGVDRRTIQRLIARYDLNAPSDDDIDDEPIDNKDELTG